MVRSKFQLAFTNTDVVEAINNLFNTWYTSFNYAITQSALIMTTIINQIDSTGGWARIPGSTRAGCWLIRLICFYHDRRLVSTALQQAPTVAKCKPFSKEYRCNLLN